MSDEFYAALDRGIDAVEAIAGERGHHEGPVRVVDEPEASSTPKLWHVVKWLPRSWRLALLEALAWPEHEVSRLVLTYDNDGQGRVLNVPLRDYRVRIEGKV